MKVTVARLGRFWQYAGVAKQPATGVGRGGPVAPIITTSPQSQTVGEGATETFNVRAAGTAVKATCCQEWVGNGFFDSRIISDD